MTRHFLIVTSMQRFAHHGLRQAYSLIVQNNHPILSTPACLKTFMRAQVDPDKWESGTVSSSRACDTAVTCYWLGMCHSDQQWAAFPPEMYTGVMAHSVRDKRHEQGRRQSPSSVWPPYPPSPFHQPVNLHLPLGIDNSTISHLLLITFIPSLLYPFHSLFLILFLVYS